MKAITIILLCFFIVTGVNGQKKYDNTFILPGKYSVQKVKSVLFQNGYSFENSTDSFFLFTTPWQLEKNAFDLMVKINFQFTDTALFMIVMYKFLDQGGSQDYKKVEYYPVFKKPGMYWKEMERIARLISPDVYYLKQ
jgi:hypothetical protein